MLDQAARLASTTRPPAGPRPSFSARRGESPAELRRRLKLQAEENRQADREWATGVRARLAEISVVADRAVRLVEAAGTPRLAELARQAASRRDWLDVIDGAWQGQHPESTAAQALAACQRMAALAEERRKSQAELANFSD